MRKLAMTLLAAAAFFTAQAQQADYPFRDTSLTIHERVQDLVSRMTIEEKISQMMNNSAAIERLGIPAYEWWNEALHGVARAGIATVFPQAIGFAASFDDGAVYDMAVMISDEARAKYHDFLKKQGYTKRYQGLTYWSPNINIFRDPRWGRGQETYGEDPVLTGALGEAFVKGLQGDNPKYYKLIANAKHYAVHSGPEYSRHSFDVYPSQKDLWGTYLPAFRQLIEDAGVYSVMCAYNRFEGQPCCSSDKLLIQILRDKWNFEGLVISDCDAIRNFYASHKTHKGKADASADAVITGTDLECGNDYRALNEAFKEGLITEDQINTAVYRVMDARMRLGMFDPQDAVPYAQIPYSVVDSKEHREYAAEMARKSIVLMKNEGNLLPLDKSKIKKIAVLGPNADEERALLGNYNGTPSYIVTHLEGIKKKLGPDVEVIYDKMSNYIDDEMVDPVDIKEMLFSEGKKGLKAEYFKGIEFEGEPILVRQEREIDFLGGDKDSIAPGIQAMFVSVRWSGELIPDKDQTLWLGVTGDDGFRLSVNGKKVIDHFSFHEAMTDYAKLDLKKGEKYDILLEYFQGDQGAEIKLFGADIHKTDYEAMKKKMADVDAIVYVGGISPMLEGEEMPVLLPGFRGGDKTTMMLPEVQTKAMQALHETGKPVIFVLVAGSAYAFPWVTENIPAVVNAWYGGQEAGTALADVLFGDYNPAGRLPMTYYASDADLPDYNDYSMDNRTYRFFKGEPAYKFGHGLSYTSFAYGKPTVKGSIDKSDKVTVTTVVTNTGERAGDEVVQLYVAHPDNPQAAIRELKGFKRIHLQPGEKQTVSFTLDPMDFAVVNDKGETAVTPGSVVISVGGSQPDTVTDAKKQTVQKTISVKRNEILDRP